MKGSLIDRLRAKTDASGGVDACHAWTGAKTTKNGQARYGHIGHNGKTVLAHRAVWEQVNGPIPDGLLVCHRCDNHGCVNPKHLFLGTDQDNVRDMCAKGRSVWRGRPCAWLSCRDRADIRVEYAAGGVTLRGLAARWGVSYGAVRMAAYGAVT
jgi:hypothetical protein